VVECESVSKQKQKLEEEDTAFRAFRSYFLAESYWRFNKYAEAASLFERCSDRVVHALEQLSADDTYLTHRLQTLKADVGTRQCVLQAAAYIHAEEEAEGVGARLANTGISPRNAQKAADNTLQTDTMFDKLDQYHAPKQLVSFPPNFQATPCKPVLFDLAFNFVDAAEVDLSSRQRSSSNAKPKAKPQTSRQATVGSQGQSQQSANEKKQEGGWFGGWLG